jgi:hypothetical protein
MHTTYFTSIYLVVMMKYSFSVLTHSASYYFRARRRRKANQAPNFPPPTLTAFGPLPSPLPLPAPPPPRPPPAYMLPQRSQEDFYMNEKEGRKVFF